MISCSKTKPAWFHWKNCGRGVKVYPEELIPHILSNEDKVFHFVSRQI